MPEEIKTSQQSPEPDPIAVAIESPMTNPDLLGKVQYSYSTISQIIAGVHDVRIAFGDQLPPDGRIEPLFGVTMSHENAHRFAAALTLNLQRLDKMKGALAKGIGQPLKMPPELAGAVNFRLLKSPERGAYGIAIHLKDGQEKTFEGEQLTPGMKSFIAGLDAMQPQPAPGQASVSEPSKK